jgi:hypothetical protein
MTKPSTDKLSRETPISSDQLLRRLVSHLGAVLPCHARCALAVRGSRHSRCRMAHPSAPWPGYCLPVVNSERPSSMEGRCVSLWQLRRCLSPKVRGYLDRGDKEEQGGDHGTDRGGSGWESKNRH